jgi:hypothetical protein
MQCDAMQEGSARRLGGVCAGVWASLIGRATGAREGETVVVVVVAEGNEVTRRGD